MLEIKIKGKIEQRLAAAGNGQNNPNDNSYGAADAEVLRQPVAAGQI